MFGGAGAGEGACVCREHEWSENTCEGLRPRCPTSGLGLWCTPWPPPDLFTAQVEKNLGKGIQFLEVCVCGFPMWPGRGEHRGLRRALGHVGHQPSGLVLEVRLTSFSEFTRASSPPPFWPRTYIGCFFSTGGTDGKGFTSFIHLLRDAFNLPASSHASHMTSSHQGCGRGYWAISLLLGNVSC